VLENVALPEDGPGAGQMVLAADDPRAAALTQWRHPGEFLTFLRSRALAHWSAPAWTTPRSLISPRSSPLCAVPPAFAPRTGGSSHSRECWGASTVMWSGQYGGFCPLNCTHVWNYAQVVAAAYPELERSMRETEFEIMQASAG
jgi:hypothetical protein